MRPQPTESGSSKCVASRRSVPVRLPSRLSGLPGPESRAQRRELLLILDQWLNSAWSFRSPMPDRVSSKSRKTPAMDQWNGLEIYEPVKQLADELLKLGGIDIQPRADDGAYVHIPFSAETMPTLGEQIAFLAGKNLGGPK
jgi:hypothetical protein